MIKKIQKNLEEENKEAEQQKIISAEKQKIRDGYLKFDNYTWEVKTSNYQSKIITAEIENLKDIDIEAFEGIISISDKLDNNLGDFKIKNTKIIPKKAKADIDMTFYEDEYYSEIKAISRQSGDLYFSFTPTKLIVDGNKKNFELEIDSDYTKELFKDVFSEYIKIINEEINKIKYE